LKVVQAGVLVGRKNIKGKLMGNDGSGWSMSVYPRHVDREGQDKRSKSARAPRIKDDGKRLPTAGTITHADPNQKSVLIKAGDPKLKKRQRRKPQTR
jgi:hypothetical protein